MRPGGLEPPTYGSANRRSIQLSHGRILTVILKLDSGLHCQDTSSGNIFWNEVLEFQRE